MRTKTILAALASFTVIGAANAQQNGDFRSKATGNWGTTSSWQIYNGSWGDPAPGDFPIAGEKATVRNGHTISLTSAEAIATLIIDSGGTVTSNANTLTVSSGAVTLNGTLNVSSSGVVDVATGTTLTYNSGASLTIDGELRMSTSSSVLKFAADYPSSGSGMIRGQDDSAKIQIAADKTLTSGLTVEGRMEIEGLAPGGAETNYGAFVNNGTVKANAAGVFRLVTNLRIVSGSGAWELGSSTSTDNPILRFDTQATGLTGTFLINDQGSLLDINQNVTTNVDITYNNGGINTQTNSVSFTFGDNPDVGPDGDSQGACVTQPSSPLTNTSFAACP